MVEPVADLGTANGPRRPQPRAVRVESSTDLFEEWSRGGRLL